MRIFGGHDYYDGVAGQWYDPALVFTRQSAEADDLRTFHVDETSLDFPRFYQIVNFTPTSNKSSIQYNDQFSYKNKTYELNLMIVYFAGKRYGGVYMRNWYNSQSVDHMFWNYDDFISFMAKNGFKEESPRDWVTSKSPVDTLKKHFEYEGSESDKQWLIDNRITIAYIMYDGDYYAGKNKRWKIDCDGLKELGFASRLDPYTAFQELSMWFGGVLPRDGNPMVEITDDKMKIQKAGFDKVTSFRNMK